MVKLISVGDIIEGKYEFRPDIWNRISDVMENIIKTSEKGEFVGKYDRFRLSSITYLVTYNNEDVGFIYCVSEYRYDYAFFVDMAIKKEFRGKGIGKDVLSYFVSAYNSGPFLIGEVKKDNFASNKIASYIGTLIYQNEYNYYLLEKNRLAEFNKFNINNEFENSMNKKLTLKR